MDHLENLDALFVRPVVEDRLQRVDVRTLRHALEKVAGDELDSIVTRRIRNHLGTIEQNAARVRRGA